MKPDASLTQDHLRALFDSPDVHVQIAADGDGSPEIARGDTFVFARDATGAPKKMPFSTLVTKDYPGFDEASRLSARAGLFRLNLDVGRAVFTELFGFAPSELDAHRDRFDFTEIDALFPHPVYGAYAWVSVITPAARTRDRVLELCQTALTRARR